jgi:hypothetical protein
MQTCCLLAASSRTNIPEAMPAAAECSPCMDRRLGYKGSDTQPSVISPQGDKEQSSRHEVPGETMFILVFATDW